MARKRRSARTGPRFDPLIFFDSDGWSYVMFTGDTLLGSLKEAQAAWEACRVQVWEQWLSWHGRPPAWYMLPPRGACHHDDLTDHAFGIRRENTLDEVFEAVDADLAAVEDFRRRRPDAAKSIPEALEVLVDDLHAYRSLARSYGDDYNGREHAMHALRGPGRSRS